MSEKAADLPIPPAAKEPTDTELQLRYLSSRVVELSQAIERLDKRQKATDNATRRMDIILSISKIQANLVNDRSFYASTPNEQTVQTDLLERLKRELDFLYQ